MQAAIDWEMDDATLEERGLRGEPVHPTVRLDGVKVRTVKISSEALEDHGIAACKDLVESEIRSAAARGVSPREMFIEIRTAHPGFRVRKAG